MGFPKLCCNVYFIQFKQPFDDDLFYKMVRFKESVCIECWLLTLEEILYDWLCRACTAAEICHHKTSWMNRFMRTEKSKESGRAKQRVISDGRCSSITKVMLIDSACSTQFTKQHDTMIELVYALLRANCSSWSIHDFTFMGTEPQWATKAGPRYVWMWSLGRMIYSDLANKFYRCPTPYLSCGSLCESWQWSNALLTKSNLLFSLFTQF